MVDVTAESAGHVPGAQDWIIALVGQAQVDARSPMRPAPCAQVPRALRSAPLRLRSSNRPARIKPPSAVQVTQKMVQLMTEARTSLAGELDGKFPDALRNVLFGDFGEDLFTRNAFRSLEIGMQPYSKLARCFGVEPDARVRSADVLRLRLARAS
jgi:hypothetical protein